MTITRPSVPSLSYLCPHVVHKYPNYFRELNRKCTDLVWIQKTLRSSIHIHIHTHSNFQQTAACGLVTKAVVAVQPSVQVIIIMGLCVAARRHSVITLRGVISCHISTAAGTQCTTVTQLNTAMRLSSNRGLT